jgi:hypothetical protein
LLLLLKEKGSHDNLTEEMMVEVVKRQHSVRNGVQISLPFSHITCIIT